MKSVKFQSSLEKRLTPRSKLWIETGKRDQIIHRFRVEICSQARLISDERHNIRCNQTGQVDQGVLNIEPQGTDVVDREARVGRDILLNPFCSCHHLTFDPKDIIRILACSHKLEGKT